MTMSLTNPRQNNNNKNNENRFMWIFFSVVSEFSQRLELNLISKKVCFFFLNWQKFYLKRNENKKTFIGRFIPRKIPEKNTTRGQLCIFYETVIASCKSICSLWMRMLTA